MKTIFTRKVLLLFMFVAQITYAQQKSVSGTVREASGVLPGVSVLIKGTTTGTETDFEGKYSIRVQKGQVLVFSYIGYTTIEKVVGDSNTINIVLKEDNKVLDEIVVVGFGNTK